MVAAIVAVILRLCVLLMACRDLYNHKHRLDGNVAAVALVSLLSPVEYPSPHGPAGLAPISMLCPLGVPNLRGGRVPRREEHT